MEVHIYVGIYISIDESADSAAAASTMSEKMSSATESLGIDDENVEAVVGKFSLAWHSLKEVNGSLCIVIEHQCFAYLFRYSRPLC